MNILPYFIRHRIKHRPNLLKIADNIGWLFFDKILRLGLGVIVSVWMARYLGPEQFGLVNFAVAFVGLFGAFAVLGLQNIVVRELVREPENENEILGTTAALQFFGGMIAFGLAVLAIHFLRPDDALVKLMVIILGSAMTFKVTAFANYWFEAKVQSKYTVWVSNSIFLVIATVKVILILKQSPVIVFVWMMFLETALVAITMFYVFIWKSGIGLRKLQVNVDRAFVLLKNSWPLILAGLSVAIYMKIDQVMLGQMQGHEAVGIYSAAVRVSEIWYFIPMSIVASVFPSILNAKKYSEERYYKRLQQLYDLMVILSVTVAIPLTFFSNALIIFLFGEAYLQAGNVLAVHIWASIFVSLGVASGKWFLAENRQILTLQRTVLGAILNIFLNFMLIPEYGVIGAAWATVAAYASAGFFYDIFQRKTHQMFIMKVKSFNIIRTIRQLITQVR